MSRRVMVVDDEPLVRSSLEAVLSSAKWTVRTHESGFGMIVAMREFEPQVVFLDVEMPGLRGDTALRAIAELQNLPFMPPRVVLFSGRSEDDLAERVEVCGAWGFLTKPASSAEIRETAEQALRACSIHERRLWGQASSE